MWAQFCADIPNHPKYEANVGENYRSGANLRSVKSIGAIPEFLGKRQAILTYQIAEKEYENSKNSQKTSFKTLNYA